MAGNFFIRSDEAKPHARPMIMLRMKRYANLPNMMHTVLKFIVGATPKPCTSSKAQKVTNQPRTRQSKAEGQPSLA